MRELVYQRSLFPWPDPSALDTETQGKLVAAETAADQLIRWNSSDPMLQWMPDVANTTFWSATQHPLSWALPEDKGTDDRDWSPHTLLESGIASTCASALHDSMRDDNYTQFKAALLTAHAMATGSEMGFRRCSVETAGDDGSRVIFPDASSIDDRIAALYSYLKVTRCKSPFFSAVVAYACICNLHPFADGNGRAARWLFCSLLVKEDGQSVEFLPLHEYFRRSRGGYVIRLRLAELRSEWNPLMTYLADIVLTMSTCSKKPSLMKESK